MDASTSDRVDPIHRPAVDGQAATEPTHDQLIVAGSASTDDDPPRLRVHGSKGASPVVTRNWAAGTEFPLGRRCDRHLLTGR